MDLDRHDFELDELIERIKGHDHRLVALQIPGPENAGLRNDG